MVSDNLPVRRLSADRPEVLNGRMQLRLRHLDQCSAWVKICEVINYGQNKSVGNEPWSLAIQLLLDGACVTLTWPAIGGVSFAS